MARTGCPITSMGRRRLHGSSGIGSHFCRALFMQTNDPNAPEKKHCAGRYHKDTQPRKTREIVKVHESKCDRRYIVEAKCQRRNQDWIGQLKTFVQVPQLKKRSNQKHYSKQPALPVTKLIAALQREYEQVNAALCHQQANATERPAS